MMSKKYYDNTIPFGLDEQFINDYQIKFNRLPVFYLVGKFIDQQLPQRLKIIVIKKWGLQGGRCLTNKIVGQQLDLTSERVRQLENDAVKLLQEHFKQVDLTSYNLTGHPYLNPQNTNFELIKQNELLQFDFNTFLAIYTRVFNNNHYRIYHICPTGNTERPYKVFACSHQIDHDFKITQVVNQIKQRYAHYSPPNEPFDIASIINNPYSWNIPDPTDQQRQDVAQFISFVVNSAVGIPTLPYSVPVETQTLKNYLAQVLRQKGALTTQQLYQELAQQFPQARYMSHHRFTTLLLDRTLFKTVGRKSIYQLADSNLFHGSVRNAIYTVIQQAGQPLQIDELVSQVIELRPDTYPLSVKAVIIGLINKKELIRYEGYLLGLASEQDKYTDLNEESNANIPIEQKAQNFLDFIKANQRLPILTHGPQEKKLITWFSRAQININTKDKKTQKIIKQINKYIDDNHIPRSADDAKFQENAQKVIEHFYQYQQLPTRQTNSQLAQWLQVNKTKYQQNQLNNSRKYHFEQLIAQIS